VPSQAGRLHGSFPKIHVALKTWKSASSRTAEATQTFRWMVFEKNRSK
jgi:hypothetical protein